MSKQSNEGALPGMPHMPALPHLRPQNSTTDQVLSQVASIARSARDAVHQIEHCHEPGKNLARIREAVTELRRITFVLQKLRSRVDDFDEWHDLVQNDLRSDPLMRYFVELRNEIEKQGLPGAVAELYRSDTGDVLGDVACFEDEYGLAVSGVLRPDVDLPPGTITVPHGLRNFRLPDPPTMHRRQCLEDQRIAVLAGLALDYLEEFVVTAAIQRFATSPRPHRAAGDVGQEVPPWPSGAAT